MAVLSRAVGEGDNSLIFGGAFRLVLQDFQLPTQELLDQLTSTQGPQVISWLQHRMTYL